MGVIPRVGVVLAAGRSERLSAVTGGGSKALLRLGGISLLERAVRQLLRAGVQEVVVVVGYQAGPVAAVARRIAPDRVATVYAEDWEDGNGASLRAARGTLQPGDDLFVVVTMDHLFGEGVLDRLVRSGEPAALVDPAPPRDVWLEGTRVRIRRGVATAFGKRLEDAPVDCGAFLLPREVFDHQRAAADSGEHSLADALTRLASTRPLRAVAVPDGSWWQDVDTPGDLKLARRRLVRSLRKTSDGPVSRLLNRPVSTRLSVGLAAAGLPADLLSIASAAVAVLGAWLLAGGHGVWGALAVHAGSVLDGVDGEVARLRLRDGPRGALLDGVLDRLTDAAVAAGLGLWALADGTSPRVVTVLVVAATAGTMLSMASKDRITALRLPPAPERAIGWLFGGRDGRLLLIAVLAALGLPAAALLAVAVTSTVALLVRTVSVWRRA